jgi:hypothetical protein
LGLKDGGKQQDEDNCSLKNFGILWAAFRSIGYLKKDGEDGMNM